MRRGARADRGGTRFARRSRDGTPLLGICLGLQWLFEGSDEAPGCRARLLTGTVHAAAAGPQKVPHVGWNSCDDRPSRLLDGVADGTQVYFTHSYAAPVTGDASPHRRTDVPSPRPSSATTSSAFSSIPRSRARPACGSCENFVASSDRFALTSTDAVEAHHRLPRRPRRLRRQGRQFEGLRRAGDPAALAERYNAEGIDELVILDVTATIEGRRALAATIRAVSRGCSFRLRSAAASGRRPTRRRRSTRAPTRSASTVPRSPIRRC